MRFDTIGTKGSPAMIMLNGSFTTGEGLKAIAQILSDEYYVILPTYDGHYEGSDDFTDREDQAEKMIAYLKEEDIAHIALIQGASMGAEIALILASKLRETDIIVDHYVFDGGPFFFFPKIMRMAMVKKFEGFINLAKNSTEEDILERISQNKMINWMIKGDITPYRSLITDVSKAAPFIGYETVYNETEACYTFVFPEFTEDEQKRFLFTWSKNEPAFKSSLDVRKHYPAARFGSPGDLGHCGFIAKYPEKYAKLLKKEAAKEIFTEPTTAEEQNKNEDS